MASDWVEKLPNPPNLEELQRLLKPLVVCLSHSWGGLEHVAANDSLDLGALGIPVRVLCLEGTPIHEHLAHRKEVKVIPLQFRPRDYFDLKLRSVLRHQFVDGVNLVHTHQTTLLGSISPWVWNLREIALLASRHIMNNHDKRTFFHRAIYGRLDALLVMSETLRENVLATHPLKDKQVKVVNLGLDFDRFNPKNVDPAKRRELWGADAETVVIGLVGRIDPAKGQATFIKAAAGLLKTLSPTQKLKFVLVGEETLGRTSNHLQELQDLVAQFHLQDSVIFAGYQDNIPEVMSAFDIFVMPSRQEAFGLVAIEAMAMECPIVISRGGSASEIVGSPKDSGLSEFGLLMRPDDAFDLQNQLRRLLDDPKERAEMGKRAREHVKRHYDRKVRVQKTIDIYDRAVRIRARF